MNKKVVLITGASSGIGESTARKYASNNYNVVINYKTNIKSANELKNELENQYKIKCLCIKADVSNDSDIESMFNEVINTFGRIDVIINNAGISIDCLVDDKTKENFMKIFEVNTYGVFLVSKVFGKYMMDHDGGNIINIASTDGIDSDYSYGLDYDASKAAVINLTHNLANIYGPKVRVNCVCPGWVNTKINKELDEDFKKKEIDKIILNRFAEPDEIANLICFLSSDDASYINDSIIKIDGGRKC